MLPVVFSIGPITLYSFAFLLAVAYFLAAFIAWRRLKELGLDEEKVIDFIILAAIFGLGFSKLFFFLEEQNFAGLSFWGGIAGATVVLFWFAKKEKWDLWQIADEITFSLLPLAVLAQVGAFLDGSTTGRPTNMPWGIYFPGNLLRTQPVSLFSAVAFFLIWLFLLRIERRWRIWPWYKSKNNGLVSLLFLGLAFWGNFLVAFWRSSKLYWYWSEIGLSLILAVTAGVVLYRRSGRNFKEDLRLLLRRSHG